MSSHGIVVHLNGLPGVGKFTVAKVLAESMNARLIDNHLVLDLVIALVGRGTPAYIPTIHKIMGLAFDVLRDTSPETPVVFTNALAKGLDEDRYESVRMFSERVNRLFFPILLTCSLSENRSRLISSERKNKKKLVDQNILDTLASQYEIYHPEHKLARTIDTTEMSPEDVADIILTHIRKHAVISF